MDAKKTYQAVLLLTLAAIIGLGFSRIVEAAAEPVWQIGTFNESSGEFKEGLGADPVFIAGKSNPAQDWLAYQPGTSNGRAGFRPHPFKIQFELLQAPSGLYTLKLALLAYSARLPWLEITLNGHRSVFYQHPRLTLTAGDNPVVFLPHYSTANITVDLPTQYLKQGTNELIFTAVDGFIERDDSNGAAVEGTSGIFYDAIELTRDTERRHSPSEVVASADPTIFYKSKEGRLMEQVDVFVRLGERPRKGQVTLIIDGNRYTQALQTEREFGEQRVEFEVPEFTSAKKGEVVVLVNGRSRRFAQELIPGKKWNLFVVPNEHLDVGYSDYQPKVAEIQSRAVDEAIDMIHKNQDFRFTLDGSWIAEQFLAGRSSEQAQHFWQLVQEKKIFLPAQYASNLTGFPTVENLVRSLYASHRYFLEHGGSFDHANITDVPSYSWSYASVLAAAGLKYFVAASDNYRAPILLYGHLHEKSPFWWEGPDGGKILMWYSRHYHHMASFFGLPPQLTAGRDSLPRFLQIYSRPEYKSDGVVIFGTQVENTDLYPQQADVVQQWNKVYAFPKLQYSGFADAMAYIAGQFGDAIPTVRGDGGPHWEDGILSDASVTARARENEQRALAAEKLATLSTFINPRVLPSREVLDKLWENTLLFDEHTWTADRATRDPESQQSIRQHEIKQARTTEGKRLLEEIMLRAMAAIADYIPNPSGTLVLFNPLSWERSSLVEVDLDKGRELVDQVTNQTVSYEVLFTGNGFRHIRFLASDVPALGYKCYTMRPTTKEPVAPTTGSVTTIESPYYRVVLHPESGAVQSIFDKEVGRELVDNSSPYRFNQYIYVTGGDDLPNRLIQYSTVTPTPKLEPHPAGSGRLVSVTKLPFGTVARLESSSLNTPRIETEIVVFEGEKKIQFTNRVHKTKVYTKEGVYFAFPFAMQSPEFRYEIQNGFVNPARDLMPGAGQEWFTVQHWVSATQDGLTAALVPVDAPVVSLGDIVRGTWPMEFGSRKGTIFSYIMNNYWDTNWPAGQGGEVRFRYVLGSGKDLNPVTLGQLGWDAMSPLEVNEIKTQDKAINPARPLEAARGSFLTVDQPNVVLVTWKLAEDGQGSVLRFLEVAGQAGSVNVKLPLLNLQTAWRCNAVEDNQQSLSVSPHALQFSVTPHQIVTIRVQGTPALK